MTIYTLITFDANGSISDMEHFSTMPTFLDDDAPEHWALYEGNVNGGDTVLLQHTDTLLAAISRDLT